MIEGNLTLFFKTFIMNFLCALFFTYLRREIFTPALHSMAHILIFIVRKSLLCRQISHFEIFEYETI